MKFLKGLKRNNDREWFNARKDVYETELKAPMLALIGEINGGLAGFAPVHVRPPEKCMMRIYRDIRFSNDKRPYKTHMAAWWARQGMEKTSGGGFYLHVSADGGGDLGGLLHARTGTDAGDSAAPDWSTTKRCGRY